MSTQICRVVELMMRSACCHTIRSRSCVRKASLAPLSPSGFHIPGAPVLHVRAYSLDSLSSGPGRPTVGSNSQQPHTERTSPSAITQRNLSAGAAQGQRRPLCRYNFLDLGETEENMQSASTLRNSKRVIVEPELAKIVADHLLSEDDKSIIFECCAGPGVLTKTLLNAGVRRIVALEPETVLLDELMALKRRVDGQLDVVHCDFFRLDPCGERAALNAFTYSEQLFTELRISEARWTDDIPVKVVGVLPIRHERTLLLKMVYALFERLSIYRYGRIELNLFMTEKEYLKLVARPGQMMNYRSFSVLWQMACDIDLLHKEPFESFVASAKLRKRVYKEKENMCLVRLRPRADLFSNGLTPSNASTLLMMIRQCLAKRKGKLIDRLNEWSPGSGSKLLAEMGMPDDVLTGLVYPDEYLQLFQLMEKSKDFTQSWLYEEVLENKKGESWR